MRLLQIQVAALATSQDYKTTGNSLSVTFDTSAGGSDENAYFLQFVSAMTGGTVTNYSDRFTLSSMTGTFPASVTAGLQTVSGTSGPPTSKSENSQSTQSASAGLTPVSASFALPYTMQTGPIRYAPMPGVGQTKITAKYSGPIYPQSSYNPYSTPGDAANAETTYTLPVTIPLTTLVNTVGSPSYD